MTDIINNSEELEVAAEPEVTAEPESLQEPIPANETNQDVKCEKNPQKRAKTAKVLGITALSITAFKVLFCPILSIAALIFDFVFYCLLIIFGVMVVYALTVLLPFLPLIIILLGVVLPLAVILLELMPIILGVIATVLSSSAKKIAQAQEFDSPECQKATSGAKKMSLIGLIVSIAAEPIAVIPTLLLSLPVLLLIVAAVIFVFQFLGLALA